MNPSTTLMSGEMTAEQGSHGGDARYAPERAITLLAPRAPSLLVTSLLDWPAATARPFDPARRATLARLSTRILRHPVLRADAASVSLAYWLRRANIDRLAAAFERRLASEPSLVPVAVGRVFHVAPGNVDTVFVYSWALAWLCGNQSIVRVSSQRTRVLAALLETLADEMADDPALEKGNRFVTYPHDAVTSATLSLWADHRVVWGGDETVSTLRALPIAPHASERAFSSKYSFSVVQADAYLAADDATIATLASGFFNDIFWFDQMACSSPHQIVWDGAPELVDAAIARFHRALEAEIDRRGYRGGDSGAMHRLVYAFDLACEVAVEGDLTQREFLGLRLADDAPWRRDVCGGGLFTHRRVETLADVAGAAGPDVQTVTHYGLERADLVALAELLGTRGVDRLVPVGEALAFDVTWDGYDLIGDFIRRVVVR